MDRTRLIAKVDSIMLSRILSAFLCVMSLTHSTFAAEDPYDHYVRTSEDFRRVKQDAAMLRKAWPAFTYMPWPYQWTIGFTPESAKWSLAHGYNGAVINRWPSDGEIAWIDANGLRFYVDHTAGKGDLHLWDGDELQKHLNELHGVGVRPKPVNAEFMVRVKDAIRRTLKENAASPNRAAYALDDEASWGHFVHPTMWRITDDPAAYPKWLKDIYGSDPPKRERWISYEDLRPKLRQWSVAEFDASPLMDQWTFNDAMWSNALGELVEYANSLDPATPVGIVGGQSPNAFGGYDYARLMRKLQFIEAYNLGSSQAIIRSFNPGNAIPAVTTHFHRNVADSVWQSWYYLAHGNRGFIGWVEGWFDGDKPKDFHSQVGPTYLKVEKRSQLLANAMWRHDGIAIYYSHPSIQLGWILDADAHGKTWINRNEDVRLGSSHNVRHAWENMLRDSDLQYSFISYVDVIQNGVPPEYQTVILPACLCLSDAEARRLREFVEGGGTLIADYLPGLWDQHGKGRADGGALDDLFGVKHPSTLKAADVFGGKLWSEVDQDAHYSYSSHADLLSNNDSVRDASAFNKAVRSMGVAKVNHFGRGTAVLMNLSPQWYNAHRAAGPAEAARRETFMTHIPAKPRVRLEGEAAAIFGHEICMWKAGDRSILFVVANPEITGSDTGGGNSVGLKSDTVHVTLKFAKSVDGALDERAGKSLGSGTTFELDWKRNEAIVVSFQTPADQ